MSNNAILVYVDSGIAQHRFCHESYARACLETARRNLDGGAMFAVQDFGGDAELVYSISPNLRDKVSDAKIKLQRDVRIKAAMDRNGIPLDRKLRSAIYKTFSELLD